MKISAENLTPRLLVDLDRLERNLAGMQLVCAAADVELWPHVKTHKSVAIARRQLALGAAGLTCAKLSEAEAMLPSGVRNIFLAHSLASPSSVERARALQQRLEKLVLAVTSLKHAAALVALLDRAGLSFPVALAVDTGLGREGLRTIAEAEEMSLYLSRHSVLQPVAVYTHEGSAYGLSPEKLPLFVEQVDARLMQFRVALGGELPLWPGCSVTASAMAGKPHVAMLRPGAYVFGDLYLAEVTQSCRKTDLALKIRSTVIDLPERGLALIDAGSKTFSSDRLSDGTFARTLDGRDLKVTRVSEEHGFVTGGSTDQLQIGEEIDWIPAHVCPVVNLARELRVVNASGAEEIWNIDAGGCNY